MNSIKKISPSLSDFLVDNFKRRHTYLRISVTERCNLRCTYCMPKDGITLTKESNLLTTEEIIKISKIFVKLGVKKIRLTGGEPTVRKDIIDIISELNKLKKIDNNNNNNENKLQEICMTTNGLVLNRKLELLKKNGLDGLNISLDTLIDGKFILFSRRNGLNLVLKSIDNALKLGISKIKINTVVMKNKNEDEMIDFIEKFTRNYPIEVRFIEYMPFDGNKWNKQKMFTYAEMLNILLEKYPNMKPLNHEKINSIVRPNKIPMGETARTWSIPNYMGKVGFITSMTESFCSSCNRLRITADGNLKVCLFGSTEVSLRDAIRSGMTDEEIINLISGSVKNKKEAHAGLGVLETKKNRPMILIGG